MRRNVFPTCLTKDDPDKTEGQSDRRLNRGRKRLEKATSKVVATRERSGELSMHCVIARVYLLYYTHPPSLCLLYPLELYSAEEIFCWMVPRYYPAAIYSFSPLSLPLSPTPPLSLCLLLLRSYLIYTLSFMRTRYTARYLRECDSGFTYADDGHVPYMLARRRIRAVAMVRKRGNERGLQAKGCIYATFRPQSA